MNRDPLVSIILPTYNGSKYIRQSIGSCLAQSHKNFELIIVDDCSMDDTPRIIESYNDKRIRYIRHGMNKRLPESLNTGFADSKGEYLTWTSDDNFYFPAAIERMLSFMKRERCDFVYSAYYSGRDDEGLKPAEIVRLPESPSFKKNNYVRACFLYSREVRQAVGRYNPEVELSEDYDYWIRVSRIFRMCYLDEPLYFYRYHKNALFSTRYWEQEAVKALVRYKHGLFSREEAMDFLIGLYARKRSRRVTRPLLSLWGSVFFKAAMNDLLEAFHDGTLSFTDCKKGVLKKVL
jgi:glycosyltransferase involved in cell wall biosynthesis